MLFRAQLREVIAQNLLQKPFCAMRYWRLLFCFFSNQKSGGTTHQEVETSGILIVLNLRIVSSDIKVGEENWWQSGIDGWHSHQVVVNVNSKALTLGGQDIPKHFCSCEDSRCQQFTDMNRLLSCLVVPSLE